jgi:glycosyltransferase involved in cell wall biosynthesis
MKKVGVYLGCHPYGGGTFQYCLTILDALSELKNEGLVDVYIVHENFDWRKILKDYKFFSKKSPDYFIFKAILKFWKLSRLPLPPLRFLFDKTHPVIKEFKKHNCDVWIFPSQDHWPILISNFKTIATVHDLMHIYEKRFPEVGNEKEFKNREFLYNNLCKYADFILSDSNLGKKQLLDCYGNEWEKKIFPLPFTIPNYFTHLTPDIDVLKKRGIKDSFFIFYPAQFWLHKNHINLLRAFVEVKKAYPKLNLILVGSDKNGSSEIKKFIYENNLANNVFILGYISEHELAGLYQLAKALVMPTFFGPTNIPPIEAEYFGCPVVYSKIYAYNEFLGKSGVILIDPLDMNDIARGIKEAINTKRSANGKISVLRRNQAFKRNLEMILFNAF